MLLPSTVDVSRASRGKDESDVGDAYVPETSNVQSTRRCSASFNMLSLTAGVLKDDLRETSTGGMYVRVLSRPPRGKRDWLDRLLLICSDLPLERIEGSVSSCCDELCVLSGGSDADYNARCSETLAV